MIKSMMIGLCFFMLPGVMSVGFDNTCTVSGK